VQEFPVDTDAPTIDIPTSWEVGKTIDYNIQDFGSGLSTLRIVIEDEDERYTKVAWNELVFGSQFNGEITWDGTFADGTIAPPGEYLVWIKANDKAGNERFGLGRVIVPEPNSLFTLFKSETTSTENLTPPTELFTDPTDELDLSSVTTSPSSSSTFGGSTNSIKETAQQSLALASGTTSSSSTTNSNVLWGAGVAAMIGAVTAYALDEKRKRREEEAQQRAQVQAEVDATNAALEASRQARREAAKINGWLEGQAMLEAYIEAAQGQGATDAQIAELRAQGATQGFGAAIAAAEVAVQTLYAQNVERQQRIQNHLAQEHDTTTADAWVQQQAELKKKAEEELQAGLAAYYNGMRQGEQVAQTTWWEKAVDFVQENIVQPVQEVVVAVTTFVDENIVQPVQNIVAPVESKPGKAPGLALVPPPTVGPPPWLKKLIDAGKKAAEDVTAWATDTWEDSKQWVNTNVVQPAKDTANKIVTTVPKIASATVESVQQWWDHIWSHRSKRLALTLTGISIVAPALYYVPNAITQSLYQTNIETLFGIGPEYFGIEIVQGYGSDIDYTVDRYNELIANGQFDDRKLIIDPIILKTSIALQNQWNIGGGFIDDLLAVTGHAVSSMNGKTG
jgi:hypothetical protein